MWEWSWNVAWPHPVLLGGECPTDAHLKWSDDPSCSEGQRFIPISWLPSRVLSYFNCPDLQEDSLWISAQNLWSPSSLASFDAILRKHGKYLLGISLKKFFLNWKSKSDAFASFSPAQSSALADPFSTLKKKKKMLKRYSHGMDYYPAIKRNDVLVCGSRWMNLENIMLSERSHRGCHVVWVYFYEISRKGKSTGTGAGGEGERGVTLMGHGFTFGGMTLIELVCGVGCMPVWMY